MDNLPESVLSIWIPGQGNVEQGKYCLIDQKPCFVANMTEHKWFRNFGGYAISKRVLDKLPRGTSIIFKRVDLNQHYITNKTKFQKKGVLVNYGGHSQWVLSLKNWVVKSGVMDEPHNLPVTDLEQWGKRAKLPITPKRYYTIHDLVELYKKRYI